MARELSFMNKPELLEAWEGQWVDGKFPLRVWLGGSEHSVVFLTEIPGQKAQKAAIKLIPTDPRNAEDELARWGRAARLSHPNLINLFGMGRCQLGDSQLLYLVMEYAEEDLSQILPTRPLTPDETKDLLLPVLDALSYLHQQGVVHGHVRPSNLMAAGNKVKLSADRLCAMGEPGEKAQGSKVYDAPEISDGARSPAADLWSLGVSIVEALTQKLPTYGSTTLSDPAIPDGIPEPFRDIARNCLRVEPKQRCTIDEIRARLRPTSPPAVTVPAVPQPSGAVRRAPWRIVLPVAAVLLLAAAFVGPRLFSHHDAGPPAAPPLQTDQSAPATPPPTPSPTPLPATAAARKPVPAGHPAKPVGLGGAVVRQVLPDASKSARNTITGKVRVNVRVNVDSSGKVTAATLASPATSQYFAKLALKAAQGWEFAPPQVNGQAAPSTWILRFRFGRAGTEVSPSREDH